MGLVGASITHVDADRGGTEMRYERRSVERGWGFSVSEIEQKRMDSVGGREHVV